MNLKELKEQACAVEDGLFTVIAQGKRMIEMTRYEIGEQSYYAIEINQLKESLGDIDTYWNSSYVTYSGDRCMSDDFEMIASVIIKEAAVAHEIYAAMIVEYNHF